MPNIERKKFSLTRKLQSVNSELASLNRELADQLIALAQQTGETEPLIHAVERLRSVKAYYTVESTPHENAKVQKVLGDTLLKIGRAENDVLALEHAIKAYRGAITIASMLGDQALRQDVKRNYNLARSLLGDRTSDASLRGAA